MWFADSLSQTRIPLNDGEGSLPAAGFGTLIPDPAAARQAIGVALETGFRHFDCAERYLNEDIAGAAFSRAIENGAVKRDDLFVTTKLWNNNHRPERVGPALEASLDRLHVDYVDSYLIHTPFAFQPGEEQFPRGADGQPIYDAGVTLIETWQAMERLVDAGRCRAIGLSDIKLDTLKEIVSQARIKPAIVQVEAHPYLPEWELLDYCRAQGIVLLAFAPLGHGMQPRMTEDPVIVSIARRIGKTPAQVALAWAIQRGTAFLTTSVTPSRIAENFDLARLTDEALEEIRQEIATVVRFNVVVETGVPGFIPHSA